MAREGPASQRPSTKKSCKQSTGRMGRLPSGFVVDSLARRCLAQQAQGHQTLAGDRLPGADRLKQPNLSQNHGTKCRAGDDQPLQDMPGSYLNQIPQTATRSLHLGIPSVKHRFKRVEWAGTGRPAFDFQPHPGLKCQSQDIACCRKAQPAEAKEAYLRGLQLTLLILLRDRKEGSKQAAEKGIPNKQQEPYTPQAVISPGRN